MDLTILNLLPSSLNKIGKSVTFPRVAYMFYWNFLKRLIEENCL